MTTLKKCLIAVIRIFKKDFKRKKVMLSQENENLLSVVYERFMESEGQGNSWAPIDDCLELVSWLKDAEIIEECKAKYEKHCLTEFRCNVDHEIRYCMAPLILETVEIILNVYECERFLSEKHRYCLEYYLSLSELGLVYNSN